MFAAALLLAQVTAAQTARRRISGPVTIYVAGTAGGGIDLFGRLVGRHLGQHLPGHPTVTVEDMPGAGGIRAANFLARQAPRDGTVMTTFAGGPVLEPLIGARNPGYDMGQFTWIGALTKDVGLCLSWGPSPFKTIEDVRSHVMVVAGTGAGSETDTWPVIINEVLGTKFKVVTGYLGTQETLLAMERGEANGRCILSLSALKAAKPDWITEKKVNILLQVGLAKKSRASRRAAAARSRQKRRRPADAAAAVGPDRDGAAVRRPARAQCGNGQHAPPRFRCHRRRPGISCRGQANAG